MAREFSTPKGFRAYPEPRSYARGDLDQWERDGETWVKDLLAEVQRMGHTGPLIGKRMDFPVADGYASYVVIKSRGGIGLVHIPHGDGYRADPCLIRGIRAQDVRERGR
jgi:hypothetical protein